MDLKEYLDKQMTEIETNEKSMTTGKIVASDNPETTAFIRAAKDRLEFIVDGKIGMVITKDGVFTQGSWQHNGTPLDDKKLGMFTENPADMLFIPPTMVTPLPRFLPANPLAPFIKLKRMLGI